MAPFAQKRVLAHERPEHKMGRPSEYKPEYCDLVVERMGEGLSLTAFAGSIKVEKQTVYRWMSEHSDFSDAVARGRATRVLNLEQKLLRARYGAQSSAAIFALRNADPGEWRDVRNVQHDHSHTIAQLTDEQLLAIASGRSSDSTPMIDVTPRKVGD